MKYEWIICAFNDAERKLKKMREDGWHPVSHSIWVDTCAQRMVSFIFRKKSEPISEKRKADLLDMMRAMVDGSK